MISFETQGLSEDYKTATGSFDSIRRDGVPQEELLHILKRVELLQTPEGEEQCPPSVNVELYNDGQFTCFYGGGDAIYCDDSQQVKMTASEAAAIITGEQSIADFDLSKGHKPKRFSILPIALVVVVVAAAAGAFFLFS